jgi:hypothetical protein
MPIICCEKAPWNIIQTQNPSRFSNEYYSVDTVSYEDPVRNPRGDRYERWWLREKPFLEAPAAPQKPRFSNISNNNNGNNNHQLSRLNSGNLHDSWWYSERPFTSASLPLPPPPPPPPPPPARQTSKPVTETVQPKITTPNQKTVSEISKLNPSKQDSAWLQNFYFSWVVRICACSIPSKNVTH